MSTFTEISFTSTDGLRLYARDYPSLGGAAKCPVICLHGLTRNSSDFEDVAPLIASLGRRVLALDARGRGYSGHDADASHYQPLVYAGDVVKFAHDLGISRAVFIGTSLGGIITMTLAVRHLDLIAGAILNDVGPVLSQKGLNRIGTYAGKGTTVETWAQAADYMKSINELAFPDNSASDWEQWARRAFTEDAQGKLSLRYDPQIALPLQNGKLKASSLLLRFAFRRLARKRPVLLIRGGLSDLIEQGQAAHMRTTAPAMLYAEVPNVGHAPMLTEPVAMTAIRDFLAQVG